jgi:hypothetical protein
MSAIKTVRVRVVGLIFLLPSNTVSTAIKEANQKIVSPPFSGFLFRPALRLDPDQAAIAESC